MKKILVLSLVVLIIFSGVVIAGNRETVFKDFAWGDTVEYLEEEYDMSFTNFENAETDDMYDAFYGIEHYRLENEDNSVGGYETNIISYGFFSGELMTIMINFEESVSLEGIIDMFTARYGEAKVKEGYREGEYTWANDGTFIVLVYEENILTDGFKFLMASFFNTEHFMKLRAWQKEQQDKEAEEKSKEW